MTNYTDGVRDDTSLIIGIAGASGSGKTVTALLIAEGLAGEDGEVAFIDTEGGRARHYFPTSSDKRSKAELRKEFLFRVKYLDMRPPFSPRAIWESINEAIKIGAKVVVVDSASDEWEGIGGLHDMHISEMSRLAKKPYEEFLDWELHKYNFPAWAVPKAEHKQHLMKNLRQVRAHVIFCFRANEVTKPIEITDDRGKKKMTVQNVGWQPICEKNMLYDLTISFMVTPDAKGVPLMQNGQFYGKLNPPYVQFFQPGKQVSVETGERLGAWARGEQSPQQSKPAQRQAEPETQQQDTSERKHDSALLWDYHAKLAATADKEAMVAVHAKIKPKFKDDLTRASAEKVFLAHRSRLNGEADADATTTYVTTVIDG